MSAILFFLSVSHQLSSFLDKKAQRALGSPADESRDAGNKWMEEWSGFDWRGSSAVTQRP